MYFGQLDRVLYGKVFIFFGKCNAVRLYGEEYENILNTDIKGDVEKPFSIYSVLLLLFLLFCLFLRIFI